MPAESHTTIEPLSDHSSALPVVARWVWETWGSKTYEETVASLDDPENCPPTLIAVADARPVGVIGFGRFRRADDMVETLWINALYVAEAERSGGLGSQLLSAAIGLAGSWAEELYVYTDVPTWYEHRGWIVIDSTDGGTVLSRSLSGAR
ncbi:MAG: GNAT family N-acetyltransferase [Acidimicrobiia bacterium]|jgi:GNAT superfamily N-acetyltransferase